MSDDDKANLADLHQVELAVIDAQDALRERPWVGHGPKARELFAFKVGFARDRLMRVVNRIYPAKDDFAMEEPDAP